MLFLQIYKKGVLFFVETMNYSGYITVEREGTEEEKERMMKNAFLPESNQPVKIKPTLC